MDDPLKHQLDWGQVLLNDALHQLHGAAISELEEHAAICKQEQGLIHCCLRPFLHTNALT